MLKTSGPPTACREPPWQHLLDKIDADRVKLLEAFRESLRLGKAKK
jgi:hypothetical protein